MNLRANRQVIRKTGLTSQPLLLLTEEHYAIRSSWDPVSHMSLLTLGLQASHIHPVPLFCQNILDLLRPVPPTQGADLRIMQDGTQSAALSMGRPDVLLLKP